MRRPCPTASSNYSLASHQSSASTCWWEPGDGFSHGEDKWCYSFRTIGLQSAQRIPEEPTTPSSGPPFGSCGGLCASSRRGANHPPQTGSRYARRRHPQSGLSFPEMLRTFQGVGKEYQGVEVATFTKAPRPPSTHLNSSFSFAEQKQPHPGPLQALQEAAIDRRRQGVRPATRKNYLASTKTFVQFMIVHELDPYQPSLNDVGAFLEFLITDHNSPATIQNYLTAIGAMYRWWARPDITQMLDSHGVHQMMKGIANTMRPPQGQTNGCYARTPGPHSQDL